MGDATRYGLHREDVGEDHIEGRSFVALFASYGHMTKVGPKKLTLMDAVIVKKYGNQRDVNARLLRDITRAKDGQRIHCPEARQLLFPEEQPRPTQGTLGL
ncbi:MAG: hypothetical protein KJ718_04610 [Nanoarchaeota archaeon]|nr:hypothetical protein [Nanoarchaeota archaeon]MBU1051808.1 hypothetical protein [Nanoarchaeota archaeon]MBU1988774.1 hypothetical protein [Nanoarchaeota archaeon]